MGFIMGKKKVAVIISFILIVGLLAGIVSNKAYAGGAFDYSNCSCVLDTVTITSNGTSYTNSETAHKFDHAATRFTVDSMSATINDAGTSSGPAFYENEHYYEAEVSSESGFLLKAHPVQVYFAYSESDFTGGNYYSYGKFEDGGFSYSGSREIDLTGKNDLFFMFELDIKGGGNPTTARYIHLERGSAEPVPTPTNELSITDITAEPDELSSEGGKCLIHIEGTNLPSNLEISAYIEGGDEEITVKSSSSTDGKSVSANSSTEADFTLKLPANKTTEDKEYIVEPVIDGNPYEIDTIVTVLGEEVTPASSKTDDKSDNWYIVTSLLLAMLAICMALLTKELINNQRSTKI